MTPKATPDPELVRMLDEYEREYQRALPPEHYMEATDHAHQRKITLESFDLIAQVRPDIQCFNELLVQYPRPRQKRPGQVVPDNFVVVHPEPIQARGNYSTHVQPVPPLLVLEYVSKYNKRKDYEDNFKKYERELKVPYYLLFYPDSEDLTLFRMAEKRYATVTPNAAGRLSITELELEAAVLGGWVRFWFRGDLLPLPGELLREVRAAERRAVAAEAELARLREELARARRGEPGA